ncbi:MAG: hypothetical protein WA902_23620, partial [Thermosynechococcaceae cyanobacterium]
LKDRRIDITVSPTVRRTLMLLGLMFLVGAVTGFTGYTMGYQSLRGITQPALNPVLNGGDSGKRRPQQSASLLSEKDILAKVKAKTSGVKQQKAKSTKPSPDSKKKQDTKAEKPKDVTPKSFPIKVEQKGMKLEVRSLSESEDGLVLNVALTNTGAEPVQFEYSFLDVIDDRDRTLLAEAQGLPTEFQANSETFFGTVKILDVSGDNIKTVSLKLANYPDQTIKLEALNIPVTE